MFSSDGFAATMARAAIMGVRFDRSNFIRDLDYYGCCVLRAAFAPYRRFALNRTSQNRSRVSRHTPGP